MRPRLCGNRSAAVIAKSACLSCIHVNKRKSRHSPFADVGRPIWRVTRIV